MRVAVVVVSSMACGSSAPAARGVPAVGNAAGATVAARTVRAEDLGAPGVLAALRWAVRLRGETVARWTPDGEALPDASDDEDVFERVWSVLEQRDGWVRIVEEAWPAAIGVWIDRADLAPAIIVPVKVDVAGVAGAVTLRPGARVEWVAGAREVSLVHPTLALRGRVDPAAIGDVFPWSREVEARRGDGVVQPGVLRARPDPQGPALVEILEEVDVRRLGGAGSWIEVELLDDDVIARGFVPVASYTPGAAEVVGHLGTWGSSNRVDVDIPAGACLYADDVVVGVTVEASRPPLLQHGMEWLSLRAQSTWGELDLLVRDLAEGEAESPTIEACPRPPSRR